MLFFDFLRQHVKNAQTLKYLHQKVFNLTLPNYKLNSIKIFPLKKKEVEKEDVEKEERKKILPGSLWHMAQRDEVMHYFVTVV